MSDLFQTSLYFFSSLLQADAALLAFGAVFIIYKLQSLDTVRQSILQTYYTKGNTYTNHMNTLVLSKNPKEIAATLLGVTGNKHDYQNYLYVVLIPAKAEEIRKSVKLPVSVIATHAVFCAGLLATAQYSYTFCALQISLILTTLLWFGWLIFLASRLAISLLTAPDKYNISQLMPEVHKIMDQ